MKRLTLNQVARANLRVNRKTYISLFLGILLAVYLAAATCLCAWGTVRGHEEQMAERVGWMDMFLAGSGGATDERLRDTGYFRQIGHVTVNAAVEGTQICAGYYDETAEALMNRKLKEGRMPEKAGEIAIEQSALARLGLDGTAAGDAVTLNMHPVRGITEEKNFTVTGILTDQSDYLEMETYMDKESLRFPAILVSPEETYKVGGAEMIRVLTYAPLVTFNQVTRHLQDLIGPEAYGVSREDGRVVFYDSGWDRAHRLIERILVWAVLGAALMLSACVGITSAMESLLARKTQDIGMLRAIGATRRQIRRVYGAEAWLLTATALPAGLLLGIATAWIASRVAPDQAVFSLNPWLLLPILALSALCVFAASRLPLFHASRQMPMGVLRDTAMLRRSGKMKSRVPFVPARLIASRRAGLHPLRQLGAAGMTALTLVCALLLGELALGLNLDREEDPAAFCLYGGRYGNMDAFSMILPDKTITREDLNRLGEIDGVTGYRSVTSFDANLVMEEVPEYFRSRLVKTTAEDGSVVLNMLGVLENEWGFGQDWLFYTDEELADARARQDEDWSFSSNVESAGQEAVIRNMLGLTGRIVPVSVYVADLDAEELKAFIVDGEIDMDRLDSGAEALVYAPSVCARKFETGGMEVNKWNFPREIREDEWDLVIRNDAFTAGMGLDLLQLTANEQAAAAFDDTDERTWEQYYRSLDAVRAGVTIGAVLNGPAKINGWYLTGFTVILSEKGARALGMNLPSPEHTDVFTEKNLTVEQEERIEAEIEQVAMRGWMDVDNQLRQAREYRAKKVRQMLLFAGLILLFFAVSVFMQVSGASRQIRSDTRTIGTLRAVGADLKTLVGCYRLPVWISAGLALVLPALFYAVCGVIGQRLFTRQHPVIMLPVLACMAACIALACIAGIRGRLAQVSRQPIVENIREL